jgi:hypothetical protein
MSFNTGALESSSSVTVLIVAFGRDSLVDELENRRAKTFQALSKLGGPPEL